MREQQLTPWFPVKVNPVRHGLYEIAYDGFPGDPPIFRLWDGQVWSLPSGGNTLFSISRRDKWRGLSENPNAR